MLATKAGAVAMPAGLVTTVAVRLLPGNVPPGPDNGAVKVTVTPPAAFPDESVTIAARGTGYCLVTCALWGDPPAVAIWAATPTVLVRENVAAAAPAGREATTVYEPATVFAVNMPEVATPLLSVVAVDPFTVKIPLAPDSGADHVTGTPFTGLPAASRTRVPNFVGNAVPVRVLCGVPAVAAIVVAVPATTVRIPELVDPGGAEEPARERSALPVGTHDKVPVDDSAGFVLQAPTIRGRVGDEITRSVPPDGVYRKRIPR